MASGNKEGSKEGKEKKTPKEEGRGAAPAETGALLQRLAEELTALRADVDALKRSPPPAPAPLAPPDAKTKKRTAATESRALSQELVERLNAPTDAAVTLGYAYRTSAGDDTAAHTGTQTSGGLSAILQPDDAQVARIAYALSSVPKVALLRALIADGPQSAAQLGERAGLTTGSLYHHLRELTHADVIETAGRNRIALTALGRFATLIVFCLADIPGSDNAAGG